MAENETKTDEARMEMIKVPVFNATGVSVGELEIDPADFGGRINKQLLHDAVLMYRANKRAGTHKTKTRSEVSGTGKKLFRQKGTGNARVGTKRTNKRRGGGTAHGPVPRDYSYAMPKKQRRLAAAMALLSKFIDHEAVVVDGLSIERPKTKQMADLLIALNFKGQTCLVATAGVEEGVYKSARNIRGVEVMPAGDLNAYALLRRKRLLLTRAAMDALIGQAKSPTEVKTPTVQAGA